MLKKELQKLKETISTKLPIMLADIIWVDQKYFSAKFYFQTLLNFEIHQF